MASVMEAAGLVDFNGLEVDAPHVLNDFHYRSPRTGCRATVGPELYPALNVI